MENNEFNLVISLLKNLNKGRSNKSFSTNENNLTFNLKSKKDEIKFPEIPPMNKTSTQTLFNNQSNNEQNINNNIISPNLINSIINDNNKNNNNINKINNIIPSYQNKPTFTFKKFKEISCLKNSIKPPNIFNNNLYLYKSNRNKSQKSKTLSTSKSPPHEKIIIPFIIRYLNFRPYLDLPKTINEEKNNNLIGIKYYFKLLGNECLLVKNLLEDNGFFQSFSNNSIEEWSIIWL